MSVWLLFCALFGFLGQGMVDEFVGELLEPMAGFGDAGAMARGEPGFPRRFVWRGREHELAEVVRAWKESGPCKNGSFERYLRKHWYEIRTAEGLVVTVYFERQGRGKQQRKRWWVYTVREE